MAETADTADSIIDATLALLAERRFEDLTVRAIADAAGVSLATLNQHFASRLAIIEAFSHRIDQIVLSAQYADMADENPRDRLFDVLMNRLDALTAYRPALKRLMAAAMRDPALALRLNEITLRSQGWMLAAAGLSVKGWRGRLATQSLAIGFAQVLRVFVMEEDPGLPRTMAKLDGVLRSLESRHNSLAKRFGRAFSADAPAAAPPPADVAAPEDEPPPPPAPADPPPDAEPPETVVAPAKKTRKSSARTGTRPKTTTKR